MRALTIKQPWATLIAAGVKDVENRGWTTSYRGPLLIHAGKTTDPLAGELAGEWMTALELVDDRLPRGGIIARAELVDVVRDSNSEWAAAGQFHWMLADVEVVYFTPCRGALGLWNYPHPDDPAPDPSLF